MKHLNFIDFVDNLVKTQQVFHSILEGNEAQTRWLLIDPMLLQGLGYSREDIIVEYKATPNFGNARFVRTLYEKVLIYPCLFW